jgi:hypothetical protein
MKKTKIITAIIAVLGLTVLAGEAIGQPGGRGRGGQGWGVGPGWGQGMAGRPQMNADLDSAQPDNYWVPGPYCPWGQGPNQNIQDWQGPGPDGFSQGFQGPRGPYCPWGQGPNQNIQGRQGRGPGGFGQGRQGRGPGSFGRDFQGRGLGPCGQGYGRRDMTIQRGPVAGRGSRGPAMMGRGGRGYQRRNISPQGWGMNNWPGQRGPGGIGRPGPGWQPQWTAPEDNDQTNQPVPPRGRGLAPGAGQGWRQGWAPGWGQGWGQNPQPEIAPDANAPEPPVVENQTEKPQGE